MKSSTSSKALFLISLSLVFYNEVAVYWLNYASWPGIKTLKLEENSIRLLLVADPQLIGENDEPWYQSWAARWDSDRYLRNTFLLANSYIKPNSTIFLGDLFDEGLKSTDDQFERYFKRFNHIYQCEKMYAVYGTRQIYISGDNDIGGEYPGDRTDRLQKRFEAYFGNVVDAFSLNSFVDILKLDLDNTVSFYRGKKRERIQRIYNDLKEKEESITGQPKFTVVLNHASVLMKNEDEYKGLISDTNACLVIKGDSHKFYLAEYNKKKNKVTKFHEDRSRSYTMTLQADEADRKISHFYELSVPTCSYRMGVPNMGFGVLTINPNGRAHFSVLWLPSRFDPIKYYAYYLSFLIIFAVFRAVYKKWAYKIFEYLKRKLDSIYKSKV